MSLDSFTDEELDKFQEGLELLGWKADARLTSEDILQLKEIADIAVNLNKNSELTPEKVDELACDAFSIMEFQVMNVDERSAMLEAYKRSNYLSSLIPLIDEALFCYYRGYYTASLAVLFIVVESYLLNLVGWSSGKSKPSFPQLVKAINKFSASQARQHAASILSVIYSHYDASTPTVFYFNRHGLLHGLRGPLEVDKMNCARIIQFLDLACSAEGIGRGYCMNDALLRRNNAYKQCVYYGHEKIVLGRTTII